MTKTKKVVVLSSMIALLVATAVLNFVFSQSNFGADGAVATANYFTEFKSSREISNNQQLIQLDEVIDSSEDGSQEKTSALDLKTKITEGIAVELMMENLLLGLGYDEVAVSVSLTSENVRVYVKETDFTQDDAIVIYSLMQEELNTSPENVFIQPIA